MNIADPLRIPVHVGFIMDGNGRWATSRGLPRTEGHREGLKAMKRVVLEAQSLGIRYVSLYAFSTENWKRSAEEVGFLMNLVRRHLASEFDFYREHRIRLVHSGNRDGLPQGVLADIEAAVTDTKDFDGITVNMAINYGGRDEIVRAVRAVIESGNQVTEATIRANVDASDLPDPDLIVRTAGEKRLSNFLLWESAYAEFFFTDTLWPDFSGQDLRSALADFGGRERKFGGVT